MSKVDLDGYVDVPARLAMFYQRHPDGSIQPHDPDMPYRLEELDGTTYLVYTACAYRHPDDPRPGIGVAWEQVPGRTSFTRGSELMNAETSAWGRAIGSLGIGSTDRAATRDEVVQAEQRRAPTDLTAFDQLVAEAKTAGVDKTDEQWTQLRTWASTSDDYAATACNRLRAAIQEATEPAPIDSTPEPAEQEWDVAAKTEADDPQPYDWRTHANDVDVKLLDVLKVIRDDWPTNSEWNKPNRSKDIDVLAADPTMAPIVQAAIDDLKETP